MKTNLCPICGEAKGDESLKPFHTGLCAFIGAHYIKFENGKMKIAEKLLAAVRAIARFHNERSI